MSISGRHAKAPIIRNKKYILVICLFLEFNFVPPKIPCREESGKGLCQAFQPKTRTRSQRQARRPSYAFATSGNFSGCRTMPLLRSLIRFTFGFYKDAAPTALVSRRPAEMPGGNHLNRHAVETITSLVKMRNGIRMAL
jgi:hypothetical protein